MAILNFINLSRIVCHNSTNYNEGILHPGGITVTSHTLMGKGGCVRARMGQIIHLPPPSQRARVDDRCLCNAL